MSEFIHAFMEPQPDSAGYRLIVNINRVFDTCEEKLLQQVIDTICEELVKTVMAEHKAELLAAIDLKKIAADVHQAVGDALMLKIFDGANKK